MFNHQSPWRADWRANQGNWKGRLITSLYRVANAVHRSNGLLRIFLLPYIAFYKIFTEAILGVEIHWKANIGPGLKMYHGYGVVIHSAAIIGSGVTLRHGVTIGESRTGECQVPTIGNCVDIGCNAVLIGPISIGDRAKIGAGAVVVHNVPPGAVAVGNPARLVD